MSTTLEQVIADAVNAKMTEFFQAVAEKFSDVSIDDLQEIWSDVSSTPIDEVKASTSAPVKKASRAKKDPNAPKKPLVGYMLFAKLKRAEVKEQNPDLKATDISKELGRIWKNDLTEEEREQYKNPTKEMAAEGAKPSATALKKAANAKPVGETCQHVMARGKSAGQKCGAAVKENGFCGKHKASVAKVKIPTVSESEEDNQEDNNEDNQEESEIEICKYVMVRGKNKGMRCVIPAKDNGFCAKHDKSSSAKVKTPQTSESEEDIDVEEDVKPTAILRKPAPKKVAQKKVEKKVTVKKVEEEVEEEESFEEDEE